MHRNLQPLNSQNRADQPWHLGILARAPTRCARVVAVYYCLTLRRTSTRRSPHCDGLEPRRHRQQAVVHDRSIGDVDHALHVNGADIQEYLGLNDFQRLRTDISGMDRATLEQIGEDLKALRERFKPWR